MSLDPKISKKDKLKVCSKALHPMFSYPFISVAELSLEKGYKPLNWLEKDSPVTVMYCISAAQRHLDIAKIGIDINREERKIDGSLCENKPLHLAQAAYNLLMACHILNIFPEKDDRLFKDGEFK